MLNRDQGYKAGTGSVNHRNMQPKLYTKTASRIQIPKSLR